MIWWSAHKFRTHFLHLRCKKGRYEKHDEDVLLFAVLAESYTAAANGGHVEYRSVQGGGVFGRWGEAQVRKKRKGVNGQREKEAVWFLGEEAERGSFLLQGSFQQDVSFLRVTRYFLRERDVRMRLGWFSYTWYLFVSICILFSCTSSSIPT